MTIRIDGVLTKDAEWRMSGGRWPEGMLCIDVNTAPGLILLTAASIPAVINYGSRPTAQQAGKALARSLRRGHRVSFEADGIERSTMRALNPTGLVHHDIARPRHEPIEKEAA